MQIKHHNIANSNPLVNMILEYEGLLYGLCHEMRMTGNMSRLINYALKYRYQISLCSNKLFNVYIHQRY